MSVVVNYHVCVCFSDVVLDHMLEDLIELTKMMIGTSIWN